MMRSMWSHLGFCALSGRASRCDGHCEPAGRGLCPPQPDSHFVHVRRQTQHEHAWRNVVSREVLPGCELGLDGVGLGMGGRFRQEPGV